MNWIWLADNCLLQSKCSTAKAFCWNDSHPHFRWGAGVVRTHCWYHPLFPCWSIQGWVMSYFMLVVVYRATVNVTVELVLLMFVHWLLLIIIHVILFIYALFIKLRWSRTNNKAFLCASLVLNYICSINRSEIYILRQMLVLIPITY